MISAAICFRDEEEVLSFTLPTWKEFCDEVVLIDTGSVDGSVDLALGEARPSDLVARAKWPGDFSKAINLSMNAATGLWVIRLDADELLVGDPDTFRHWYENFPYHDEPVAPSVLVSLFEFHDGEWKLINWRARMFRWSDGWRFRFPIDAQPVEPEGCNKGVLIPPQVLSVYHLRESTREDSLDRNECYVWRRLIEGPPPDEDEIAHYETVLEICDMRKEGE